MSSRQSHQSSDKGIDENANDADSVSLETGDNSVSSVANGDTKADIMKDMDRSEQVHFTADILVTLLG